MTHQKLTVVLAAFLFAATVGTRTGVAATTLVHVDTVLGGFTIELLDDTAPGTVANFLNYVSDGDYDGTFFHRAIPTNPLPSLRTSRRISARTSSGRCRMTCDETSRSS